MTFCYIISLTFIASKAFPKHLTMCSYNDNISFQYCDSNIYPCGNETNRSLGRLCCLCNTVVVIFHVSVN